jgi:hypothetical protein
VIYLAFSKFKCKCIFFTCMGLNFKQTQSCKCNFATKNKTKFLSTFKHSFSQLCSIDHWTVVVVVVNHSKRKDCKIKIFYFFSFSFRASWAQVKIARQSAGGSARHGPLTGGTILQVFKIQTQISFTSIFYLAIYKSQFKYTQETQRMQHKLT